MVKIIEKICNSNKFVAGLFAPKVQMSIGLDIGTSSVKAAVYKVQGKERALVKLAALALKQGDDLATSLQAFVKALKVPTSAVNISLAGSSVITRYLSLPKMSLADLRSTMKYEAKEFIPYPLEEVIIDCSILKDKNKDNTMSVLLTAAKKNIVQERMSLLEKIGLSAKVIDIDCLALTNAFLSCAKVQWIKTPRVVALLNIGSRFTNMVIIEDGVLKFSRDIIFGSANIIKKLVEVSNVSHEQAEACLVDPGKAKETFTKIEPVINNLYSEIRVSIDYYENQNGIPVDLILISGGLSKLPNLAGFLNTLFNIPVEVLNVLRSMPRDAAIDQREIETNAEAYAVAVGLALR